MAAIATQDFTLPPSFHPDNHLIKCHSFKRLNRKLRNPKV